MPNAKISALTAATLPIAGTAQVPIVQAGLTKVASLADIRNTPEPFVMVAQAQGSVSPADANTVKVYARSIAGRVIPEFMLPSGVNCSFQPAIFNSNVFLWSPTATGTTVGYAVGGSMTSTGSVSMPTLATTSLFNSMRRIRWATANTAGAAAGIRSPATIVARGSTGIGGFFFFCRFGLSSTAASTQAFVGLAASTSAFAGEASALTNMIGMGYDTTDATGNGWKLMMNSASGTATSIALTGAPRDTTSIFDFSMYCAPGASQVTVRIYNQTTATLVLDNVSYTTNLPVNTAFMAPHCQIRNGATTSQPAIDCNRIYIETDL